MRHPAADRIPGRARTLGSDCESDIGTFENDDASRSGPQLAGDAGVATVPEAERSLETDSSDGSEDDDLIYDVQQEKRLVAAIEIISRPTRIVPSIATTSCQSVRRC